MLLEDEKSYRLIHDPDLKCVTLEWKEFTTGEGYKQALLHGLDVLSEKKADKWISNQLHLGIVAQEGQKWLLDTWIPLTIEKGVKYLAVVLPEKNIGKMVINKIAALAGDVAFEYAFFDNAAEAVQWLKKW